MLVIQNFYQIAIILLYKRHKSSKEIEHLGDIFRTFQIFEKS